MSDLITCEREGLQEENTSHCTCQGLCYTADILRRASDVIHITYKSDFTMASLRLGMSSLKRGSSVLTPWGTQWPSGLNYFSPLDPAT